MKFPQLSSQNASNMAMNGVKKNSAKEFGAKVEHVNAMLKSEEGARQLALTCIRKICNRLLQEMRSQGNIDTSI